MSVLHLIVPRVVGPAPAAGWRCATVAPPGARCPGPVASGQGYGGSPAAGMSERGQSTIRFVGYPMALKPGRHGQTTEPASPPARLALNLRTQDDWTSP